MLPVLLSVIRLSVSLASSVPSTVPWQLRPLLGTVCSSSSLGVTSFSHHALLLGANSSQSCQVSPRLFRKSLSALESRDVWKFPLGAKKRAAFPTSRAAQLLWQEGRHDSTNPLSICISWNQRRPPSSWIPWEPTMMTTKWGRIQCWNCFSKPH